MKEQEKPTDRHLAVAVSRAATLAPPPIPYVDSIASLTTPASGTTLPHRGPGGAHQQTSSFSSASGSFHASCPASPCPAAPAAPSAPSSTMRPAPNVSMHVSFVGHDSQQEPRTSGGHSGALPSSLSPAPKSPFFVLLSPPIPVGTGAVLSFRRVPSVDAAPDAGIDEFGLGPVQMASFGSAASDSVCGLPVACLTAPGRRLLKGFFSRAHWYHDQWLPRGTTVAAVSNIGMSLIGIGTLSMPYTALSCGGVGFVLLTAFVALAMLASIYVLSRCAQVLRAFSFEVMANALFGPVAEVAVEFALIFDMFGSAVAYVVVLGDLADVFSPAWLYGTLSPHAARMACQCIAFACTMLPLSLPRTLEGLKYASLVGVASMVSVVFGVTLFGVRHGSTTMLQPVVAGAGGSMVQGLMVLFFSMSNQANGLEIYAEVPHHTPAKFLRLSTPVFFIVTAAYIAVGLTGMATFGPQTQSNILQNFTFGSDFMLTVAFAGIAIKTALTFPLLVVPTREAIFHMRGVANMADVPTRVWVESTVAICSVALVLALLIPSITSLFELIGALTCGLFCFLLPAIYALKLGPRYFGAMSGRMKFAECAVLAFMLLLGSFACTVGTYFSIVALLQPPVA